MVTQALKLHQGVKAALEETLAVQLLVNALSAKQHAPLAGGDQYPTIQGLVLEKWKSAIPC